MHRLHLEARGLTDRLKPRWFCMKLQFILRTKQFPSASASDTPDSGAQQKQCGSQCFRKTVNENLCWMRDRKCCVRDKSIFIAHHTRVQFRNFVQFAGDRERGDGGSWRAGEPERNTGAVCAYTILSIYAIER